MFKEVYGPIKEKIMVAVQFASCNDSGQGKELSVAFLIFVFTARCYAECGYEIACRLAVRPSVTFTELIECFATKVSERSCDQLL